MSGGPVSSAQSGSIPTVGGLDASLALMREGYLFMANRRGRTGTDSFRCRLMGRKALCICGADAARFFYTEGRFTRRGAMPPTTLRLLQDLGSVQLLDGDAHAHRKQIFLTTRGPETIRTLCDMFEARWHAEIDDWSRRQAAEPLLDRSRLALSHAVCLWAGIDYVGTERAEEFGAMVDGAGSLGGDLVRATSLRRRSEAWARGLISAIRAGTSRVNADAPAAMVARFRDIDGEPLSEEAAAVELLNLLRPTVAVSHFIVFAALALNRHPQWRERVLTDAAAKRAFVQEVRRHAPFFPFIGGIALDGFEWRGEPLPEGQWVILDLYGTNRDPALWHDPERFEPDRFTAGGGDLEDAIVPQGAGDVTRTHRCPGEDLTIALTMRATELLARLDYHVPEQDMTIDLGRMPALPRDGFRMIPAHARNA